MIQSASLLSAPSTEDHQTATALCSYCMRKRPEGRGLWGENKNKKINKTFFFTPVKQTNNKKQLCFPPLNNTNKNKLTTILQSEVTQISPIRLVCSVMVEEESPSSSLFEQEQKCLSMRHNSPNLRPVLHKEEADQTSRLTAQ